MAQIGSERIRQPISNAGSGRTSQARGGDQGSGRRRPADRGSRGCRSAYRCTGQEGGLSHQEHHDVRPIQAR